MIVGGIAVQPGSIRYHVSLESPLGLSFCGGAIIGDRHVITAAHCVTDQRNNFSKDKIYVVAGTVDLDKKRSAVVSEIEKAYIPSVFNRRRVVGDIAIIRVSTYPFVICNYLRLIFLDSKGGSCKFKDLENSISHVAKMSTKFIEIQKVYIYTYK